MCLHSLQMKRGKNWFFNCFSLESFKNEIKNGFSRVSLQSIKKAVSTFTTRVRKVEEIKGGYLEKRKINKN